MKVKKIVNNTANRGEFNRAYKRYLEGKGKIRCSHCKYHDNENYTGNYYGGYEKSNGTMHINYPNWKLVSKNNKQWMKKSMKVETKIVRWSGREYIEITW